MIRKRHDPFLLASLVVTVVGIVVARAQEPAPPRAGEPLVVDQLGPTIKDAYKDLLSHRHGGRSARLDTPTRKWTSSRNTSTS